MKRLDPFHFRSEGLNKDKGRAAISVTPACRLYLITPPILPDLVSFTSILAATLEAGDVACVQLRLKEVDDETLLRTIDVLRPVVQDRDIAFILNDRPDLAAQSGCDGTHVGQDDMPYAKARQLVGANAIIGVTCHNSRHLGMVAAEKGADYVAFGTFFPTMTKNLFTRASITLVEWWTELMVVPCVAIGGITTENCSFLVRAGVDFLAVSAGVWDHPAGPAAAVVRFNAICNATGN